MNLDSERNFENENINTDTAQQENKAGSINKSNRTSRWVILLIVAGVLGVMFYCAGGVFGLFKPLDIGVRYTDQDYISAIEKTGIEVTIQDQSEQNSRWYDNKDYKFSYSDFQQKAFELTPEEATALLNNIAPGFFWLDNVQVNVRQDDTFEGSSTVNLKKIKDAVPKSSEEVVIPLPDQTNIYISGIISIKNNKINVVPKEIKIGCFQFPKQYLTYDNIRFAEKYLSEIIESVPGLKINTLEHKEGKIFFDGVIPQQIKIEKK